MAEAVSLHSLPLFVRLAGRPVILLGEGEAADAKRRLLNRAGASIVDEDADAALAIVAIDDEADALAAVARLKARGVLVNAVDRSDHCDFTLPAIVDRAPVLVAIGTGGVSAGLAAALRQRLEALLPADLGQLAEALHAARAALRERFPDSTARRRALADAMRERGTLDPLIGNGDVAAWLAPPWKGGDGGGSAREGTQHLPHTDPPPTPPFQGGECVSIRLTSTDPDDLTIRQARALASADRVCHRADVPAAILDRARADAARVACDRAPDPTPGLTVYLEMHA